MHNILDCFPQIIFAQKEITSVHNSPKAFNYRIFKTDFKFEEYFNILDEQNSLLLCKFRTTNHKLPIEKGRNNVCPKRNNSNLNVDFDRIST
jgi:hypothetical protein